jgi:hypothetical protein
MKGMFFQKRIVFFLFQPVWCARALLVPGRQVARGRFTQRFRLGAFQGNDFLRHDFVLFLFRCWRRLLFFLGFRRFVFR